MKARPGVVVVLLAACGLAVAIAVLVWPRGRGPKYNGRRLSQWAQIYQEDPARRDAIEAVQAMADQVRPYAVGLIRNERLAAHSVWEQRLQDTLPAWLRDRLYVDHGQESLGYFLMLGSNAVPAIPELETIASRSSSWESATLAMQVLGTMGTNALPALMRVARDRKVSMRHYAMLQVSDITKDPAVVSPLFLECVKDPEVALNAIVVAGSLKLDPGLCAGPLIEQVKSGTPGERGFALTAIGLFAWEDSSVISVVREALDDADEDVRMEATNTLQKIAPNVPTAPRTVTNSVTR